MQRYARDKLKWRRFMEEPKTERVACTCTQSAAVTVLPLTPLEELLVAHPPPWRCEPHEGWRGKEQPEQVIYDARWDVVELCDDPAWRPALVQAVNLASAIIQASDQACSGK